MDLKEVVIAFEERRADEQDSDTLARIIESGYKKGKARKEEHRGTTRCRLNQLVTGTISLPTLRWLLKWRAEHIWECPSVMTLVFKSKSNPFQIQKVTVSAATIMCV